MDIPTDKPVALRLPAASTVTLINNDAANDVYISRKRQELLAKFPPDEGQVVAHGGVAIQWPTFDGNLYLRAQTALITKFVVLY